MNIKVTMYLLAQKDFNGKIQTGLYMFEMDGYVKISTHEFDIDVPEVTQDAIDSLQLEQFAAQKKLVHEDAKRKLELIDLQLSKLKGE